MKTLKIALYELKKILRDWRWIALFLLQPICATVLLGLAAYHYPQDITVAIYSDRLNQYSDEIINDLRNEKKLNITIYDDENQVRQLLKDDKANLGIILDIGRDGGNITGKVDLIENVTIPEISGEGKKLFSDLTKDSFSSFAEQNAKGQFDSRVKNETATKSSQLQASVASLREKIVSLPLPSAVSAELLPAIDGLDVNANIDTANIKIDSQTVEVIQSKNTTKKLTYFDYYASGLIVLLVIFIGMNRTATTITQEREEGTFERFFVTPFTKSQMIFGKMLAYTTASIALTAIVTAILAYGFSAALGPMWLVLLITMITGLTAVALGLLISSLTYNIAESINVSVLLFFIFLIIDTLIFQSQTMHPAALFLSKAIPFTYSVLILREVNLLNLGFMDIWKGLAILVIYLFAFLFLSAVVLRRKAT